MSNFEWRAEEEEWADTEPRLTSERRPRRRRLWLLLLLVIGLLVAGAGLAGWRIQAQLQQAEDVRTDDIIASYVLVNQAAAEHDRDILTLVLAASDREWQLAQLDLVDQGLLFEPAGFELWRLPHRAQVESVNYAPSLRAAEVVILETYQVTDANGTYEVQFRRTDQYRRSDRWLWSPPDDAYWQGQANQQWTGQRLSSFFPARDQDVTSRLTQDLDALLAELCQESRNIDCPEPLQIQLLLVARPESLLRLAPGSQGIGYFGRQLPYYANGLAVALPAPSLIGRPVDEAAYQALYMGYARHLVATVLAGLVRQPWSDSQAVYEAALRSFWVELGLLPWPAGQVQTAVQPLPAQDIQLICQNGRGDGTILYRLDLSTMNWWPEWDIRDRRVDMAASPGGEGVFLHIWHEGGPVPPDQLIWWQGREAILVHTASGTGSLNEDFSWQVRQEEAQLVVQAPSEMPPYLTAYLYDLSECRAEECATRVDYLRGRPLWSSDGRQLLVRDGTTLWHRQDSPGQGLTTKSVDQGIVPFWLDDQRFGYVRLSAGQQQDVIVANSAGGGVRVMFALSELMAALPKSGRPDRLYIGHIDPGSAAGRLWIILALGLLSDGGLGAGYLFSYHPDSGELTLLLHSPELNSFNVSPDGRWLAASVFDSGERRWNFEIHDTIKLESRVLPLGRGGRPELPPNYEWSADSQWLLALERGRLVLYPVTAGQQQILTPPSPGCTQAVWVNRDEPD